MSGDAGRDFTAFFSGDHRVAGRETDHYSAMN
jgi:hypothetical protein